MPTELWFPTNIYYGFAPNSEISFVQQELTHVIEAAKLKDTTNPWDDTVKTDFKYGLNTNCFESAPLFTKNLQVHVSNYLGDIFPNKSFSAKLNESWVNFYERGGYQNAHIHTDADISGVYFYATNEKDGDTVFLPPPNIASSKLCRDDKVMFIPRVGKFILFPSEHHKCPPQRVAMFKFLLQKLF